MPAAFPPLHAILDVETASRLDWTPLDVAQAFFDGGARFLQIRSKHLAAGPLLDLSARVVERGRQCGARVIVNDRLDIARLAGAAGVHVGQRDLAPVDVRVLLGDEAVVGLSTHTHDELHDALSQPISYVAVGPVFATQTKETGYRTVGLEMVSRACAAAGPLPVVAIGGITLETAPLVWGAGATAVAVIGDLLHGGRPAARVADYNRVASAHFGG